MKNTIFILAFSWLMFDGNSAELTLEKFMEIIKMKQDNVKLSEGLKVLPFHKNVTFTLEYFHPTKGKQSFSINSEVKSIQGKYLVSKFRFPQDPMFTYAIRAYDGNKRLHINYILFSNKKFVKAYGKCSKDLRVVNWESSSETLKSKGVETIANGKSITEEKHYDLKGNYLYSTTSTTEVLKE